MKNCRKREKLHKNCDINPPLILASENLALFGTLGPGTHSLRRYFLTIPVNRRDILGSKKMQKKGFWDTDLSKCRVHRSCQIIREPQRSCPKNQPPRQTGNRCCTGGRGGMRHFTHWPDLKKGTIQ